MAGRFGVRSAGRQAEVGATDSVLSVIRSRHGRLEVGRQRIGTSAATAELLPEVVDVVDDVVDGDAALDEVVVELLLLLLPQPTITAALSSATSTADRRVQELLKIRLLIGGAVSVDPITRKDKQELTVRTGVLTPCQ